MLRRNVNLGDNRVCVHSGSLRASSILHEFRFGGLAIRDEGKSQVMLSEICDRT